MVEDQVKIQNLGLPYRGQSILYYDIASHQVNLKSYGLLTKRKWSILHTFASLQWLSRASWTKHYVTQIVATVLSFSTIPIMCEKVYAVLAENGFLNKLELSHSCWEGLILKFLFYKFLHNIFLMSHSIKP